MKLHDLATPCALIDLDILEDNAARMTCRANDLGVRLRPHIKTHKCLEAARLQIEGNFGGITVSTLAEAEFFARAGFEDIIYAVPMARDRIERAAGIGSGIERFGILVDRVAIIDELDVFARSNGAILSVHLKVDCGYHRAGIDPEGDEGLEMARRCHESPHLDFRGILTHAGHSYRCRDRDELGTISAQERDVMTAFADRLADRGIPTPEISIGSTPTISVVEDLRGISEIRPGNYIFHDAHQAAIGSCSLEQVAFFVLATVIGHYPARGAAILDAGAMALSKDHGPEDADPECGYGVLCDETGAAMPRELRIESLSQEHGMVRGSARMISDHLPPDGRVRVVPNHSCLAAALFDRYYVVRGERVVDTWRPVRGW